jgi:dTDP-glucose pyrophosphorylase
MNQWKDVILRPETTIREAMQTINKAALRIALVCDAEDKLLGTVTDGDIRRGLLSQWSMQDAVIEVMNKTPIVVKESSSIQHRKKTMESHSLLSLPIIDDEGYIVGLETLSQSVKITKVDNPVFIMAGGFGTRLRPLTDTCPKPMLNVGKKPMLAHLIDRFIELGFYNFYISTHYIPEKIHDYFGDGSKWNVNITYIHEECPLGTGGALGLLPQDIPKLPLIMMNGDVLTKLDFKQLLNYHQSHNLDATMCVREVEHTVSFGVVESKDGLITNMVEKPTYRYHINTGIYVLSPECVGSVERNVKLDLPTLLEKRIKNNEKVGIYRNYEYWLDIGQMADYHKAQQDIEGLF